MKLKTLTPWKESYDQPRQHIQKQRHYFANKGSSSPGYGFSCGHVWMWELDCEEGWVPKNWCFWTVVLEKTLESPLDCKEIQPVHSKGDQPWDFFGRNDTEAETPVLWPPHAKRWLIGKDSDAGRDWGQEEKGMTGWDGWMASLTRWTWVWVNSGSWWWTGRPGVLRFMGSQRVRHDWATELNWTGALAWLTVSPLRSGSFSNFGVSFSVLQLVAFFLCLPWNYSWSSWTGFWLFLTFQSHIYNL